MAPMKTLVISDDVYNRLRVTAQERGLKSVEELLESWPGQEICRDRKEAVKEVDALRNRLLQKYGTMADSVPLVREDRGR